MNMEDLYRLLRAGHVQAQGIVDTVSDPMLVLDGRLCVQAANLAFFSTFAVDRFETIGRPIYDLGNGQWDIPELRDLLEKVLPRTVAVVDYRVEHDFPGLGKRSMLLTARTLHHPDNASHSMLLSIVDVTDRDAKAVAKDMLFGELRHRMNNLFGVAQALAHQTTTEGRTAEEYRDTFLGRFRALVEAQDLAFAERTETDLKDVCERITAPYRRDSGCIVIDAGPPISPSPRIITSLSLVLHELATNSLKYGACSVPDGRVNIDWDVSDNHEALTLRWAEHGGPPTHAPDKTGFGTRLIQSTIAYSLHGKLEQDYRPDGLHVEIVVPLQEAAPVSQ